MFNFSLFISEALATVKKNCVTAIWAGRVVSVSITVSAFTGFIYTICTHIYQNSMVAKLINLTLPAVSPKTNIAFFEY